jgi:valyl-tRNA synthetase
MLNPYEHEDADRLTKSVGTVVEPISSLIARAQDDEVELIYVNDNYGDWNSSSEELAQRALEGARPDLVEPMTPLEYLLGQKEIDHLVLVGQVTEQCILYSALDAYVRHFHVTVPPDGVACIHENLADAALEMMERNMRAELTPVTDVRFSA